MENSLLIAGLVGNVAGHAVAWGLKGATIADITKPESLMAVGLSLGSELAVLMVSDPILSLAPNVAQAGAVLSLRGSSSLQTDPQFVGAIGSAGAKTLYAFQK